MIAPAHSPTCEEIDADLADAVSKMLLAVAADLKAAAEPPRSPTAIRKRISEAALRLIEAANWLADDPVSESDQLLRDCLRDRPTRSRTVYGHN